MTRKERIEAKLLELWREYLEPLRGKELMKSRLRWEDWEGLRKELVSFARKEIGRRKWRGARGGVVSGGGDAEDVVDEVILEVLAGKCRLAFGWTRERLTRELQRLVSQRVRVLHGLKETRAVQSEWKVAQAKAGEEPVSVFEELVEPGDGEEEERCNLARMENRGWRDGANREESSQRGSEFDYGSTEERERLRDEIEAGLKEETLRQVFGCLWEGMKNPEEIARKLGMEKREVIRARERLGRRLRRLKRKR